MRTAVRFLAVIAVSTICFGCSGKGGDKPQGSKAEQKAASVNLALKYMQGVQDGDKNKMYEASNLTREIVNDNREKLIHPAQYNQTDQQRKDSEHALRISGNIDFIAAKISKMLPKSATFQIAETTDWVLTDGVRKTDHSIKITYGNQDEAMRDKAGKPVKEMVLHLQQISRSVNGSLIHNFTFDTEKIAERDFQVISYY